MTLLRRAILAAACATALVAPAQALEPYQMVRSLQLVQDRIAGGDHAALPMQLKLLGMIDSRLKSSSAADFDDVRNLRATLIYGMSGGNPATVAAVLGRVRPQETDKPLADGISSYLRGDLGPAMQALDTVDPTKLAPEIGAFVALVKGSILSQDDSKTAIRLFEWARLLGPGTLVEEAALRRTLPVSADAGNVETFLRSVSLYVRRFLRSPYATQFADSLVKGIVKLNTKLDFPAIETMIAEMSVEHQKVIYLRLARTAAIEGLRELSDFASLKAEAFETGEGGAVDARAALYASLASVVSEGADETLEKLRSIDPRKLSPADRQLLDAAVSIASSVVADPLKPEAAQPREPAQPTETTAPEATLADTAKPSDAAMGAPASAAQPEPETGEATVPATLGTENADAKATPPALPAAQADADDIPDGPDAAVIQQAGELVSATKAKLEEIDKLLEQTR